MSFYPSLEDLEVDGLAQAQRDATIAAVALQQANVAQGLPPSGPPLSESVSSQSSLYSHLLQEFLPNEYMGFDISERAVNSAMTPELALQVMQPKSIVASTLPGAHAIASITPKNDPGMVRAEIKQGVKQVVLAKDGTGKLGLAFRSVDKGVFVCFVWKDSAAALGGIRFGDQILQINGESVAGWSEKQTLKFIEKANPQYIAFIVRERPLCRIITMVKDSLGHVGFTFRKGEITQIVKDSSAAKNGMLINHFLVEVNGQNVVGMNDDQISQVFKNGPNSMTITIMPSFIFNNIMKKISMSTVRKYQEHGLPEI